MDSIFSFLLMAAPEAGATGAAGTGGALMSFLPFVLIIGIFYFLIIRPQNKKQKDTQKMLDALKKGDRVVTIGGIHGVIHKVKDNSVIIFVDSAATVKMEFSRSAIASVTAQARDDDDDEDEKQIEDMTASEITEAKQDEKGGGKEKE